MRAGRHALRGPRATQHRPAQIIVVTATRHATALVVAAAAMNVVTREQIGERGDGHRAAARASLTRRGTQVSRDLDHGLTLSAGGDNLGQLRRAEDSPLFTGAKPPPTWRIALRGPW